MVETLPSYFKDTGDILQMMDGIQLGGDMLFAKYCIHPFDIQMDWR